MFLIIMYQVIDRFAGFEVPEPGNMRFDVFAGDHRDPVPFVQPGMCRELRPGFIHHGIIKMEPEIAVDIESKIQDRRAFVDQHGAAVFTENPDFFVVGVTGFDFIDIVENQGIVTVDNIAVAV